ncbi:hypothetical protein BAUCODRAFT_32217 [Baudoinia panamericana UAMH 10762]|uniref:Uncharacterized protein n=1 Tax=Baudoinia panamericana (strain UAMH 10762) TaxID=717646 RepID=M2MNG3_BAUPA|nr:uncharacterized protein BAUCODRAFT_32217 [Baudoinia panamericana UAMH 10762]EMC98226.1 hypothetical protein BAUCODRAFT_32217 [Baudoinia panamericana UAMH 10762]
MEDSHVMTLAEQVMAGFEALQEEYRSLFAQQQSLERKLATAREQYNDAIRLYGSGLASSPPLSLSSSASPNKDSASIDTTPVADLVARNIERRDVADRIRGAVTAAEALRRGVAKPQTDHAAGVKIWSGPAADQTHPTCALMPSIMESPLEQDFTVEGKPSQLGCPFASMANKKLSSHAASVLSRYNTRESSGAVPSTAASSVSRINGRDSFSKRGSRRASFVDPIKAEICGLSDHNAQPREAAAHETTEHVENVEVGVCPIRFLDQHSPEEVATYFEKHKHELPRSHEVCVRRYQSNEEQIRELDAKYGNLVSMIQGLGVKHKEYLPQEPEHDLDGEEEDAAHVDAKSAAKIQKWASSVSAQAGIEPASAPSAENVEERQPHFDRPMREIRVGESPSRPWGLPVPAKYLEHVQSETSSVPAHITSPATEPRENEKKAAAATCPFGFDRKVPPLDARAEDEAQAQTRPTQTSVPEHEPTASVPLPTKSAQPAFVAPQLPAGEAAEGSNQRSSEQARMLFTGPVFIGYSAEDAAKILRESGMGGQR